MAIQWFPGHMAVTKQAIIERIKSIDVVIELLDARLPASSANPMLADIIQSKPSLKILNKQDLADPTCTAQWLAHYNAMPNTKAIGLSATDATPSKSLIQACQTLAPNRKGLVKPMRVLICGIPNVGKSTLINTLTHKRAAKTGDEAGVTKLEQRICLADDFYLYDTPGMLWPRIIVEKSGYNLAASGAVGRNAFEEEEVALELLDYLIVHYPHELAQRYKLDVEQVASQTDEQLLESIGIQRGALLGKGRVNLQKAAEIVLFDFRTASIGKISLETPDDFTQWLEAGQHKDIARQIKKDAIELDRQIRFKQFKQTKAPPRPSKRKNII